MVKRLALLVLDGLLAAWLILYFAEQAHECDVLCQAAPLVAIGALAVTIYFTVRAFSSTFR